MVTNIETNISRPLKLSSRSYVLHDGQAGPDTKTSRPSKITTTFKEAKSVVSQIDPAKLLLDLTKKYPPLTEALAGKDINGLYDLLCARLGVYDKNVFYAQLNALIDSSYDPEKRTRRPGAKTLALILNYPGGIDALFPEEAPKAPKEEKVKRHYSPERRPLDKYPLLKNNPEREAIFMAAGLPSRVEIEALFAEKGLKYPAIKATAFLNGYVIGIATLKFTPQAYWIAEKCKKPVEILFRQELEVAEIAHQKLEEENRLRREQAKTDREATRARNRETRRAERTAQREANILAKLAERQAQELARQAEKDAAKQAAAQRLAEKEAVRQARKAERENAKAQRQAEKRLAREQAQSERLALKAAGQAKAGTVRDSFKLAQRSSALRKGVRRTSSPRLKPAKGKKVSTTSYTISARELERLRDPFYRELVGVLPTLRKIALKWTRNVTDAEDLLSETIDKAVQAQERYRLGSHILYWTSTIMKNAFLGDKRRDWRVILFDPHEYMPSDRITAGQQYLMELRDLEERIFPQIPKEQLDIVIMMAMGMDYGEIAASRNMPIGTVKSRAFRGRATLKKLFDPDAMSLRHNPHIHEASDGNKDLDVNLIADGDKKSDSLSKKSLKATKDEILGAVASGAQQDGEHDPLFDLSQPFSEIDTGWFTLRINNQTQTSFIKGTMVSLSHEETVAILNLRNFKNGQRPEIIESLSYKLATYKAEWNEIIQHGPEGYGLSTVIRDFVSVSHSQNHLGILAAR